MLIPEGRHDPINVTGGGIGSHIGTVNALLRPWQKFPRTPPSIVKNDIPGTQNHSPENFRKILKSGLFLLWQEENYLTNEEIGASIPALQKNPGRYSTMNPLEVMYGEHSTTGNWYDMRHTWGLQGDCKVSIFMVRPIG